MAQYQTISERDIARGIDARSTENLIEPGFAEDLVNVDTNSNGFLSKRRGYQGYYGYLPIRITQVQHSGTSIIFTIDGNIDTTNISSSPIVVYGKTSSEAGSPTGDWSATNAAMYYSSFSTDTRKTLTAGSGTLTVPETEHGNDTPWLFARLVESTSATENDNSYFISDAIQIDVSGTTYDIDFDYASIPSDLSVFALVADKQAVAGTTYTTSTTVGSGATATLGIAQSTHNLNNYNILVEVYVDNGASERELIEPDSVTITVVDADPLLVGKVNITITNSTIGTQTFYVILTEVGIANTATKDIGAGATDTIELPTSDDFNFIGVYYNDGSKYNKVTPDSVVTDVSADTVTVTVTNSTSGDQPYIVMWEPIEITSSTLTVTDDNNVSPVSENYTDTNPQLTLWGIPHTYYKTSSAQEGHITHIDSYRSLAEQRLVAGLGGNLFSAQTRSEAGTTYLIPTTNISIENRVSANLKLAPLFEYTTDGLTRSRGIITDASISSNKAVVTAVSYVSATTADYTLSFTSAQTLTSKIDTNDKFVIAGMGHSAWDGTWAFEGTITNDGTTDVTIRLTNTNAIRATYDETGARGTAACYTDKITLTATSTFSVNDDVLSDSITVSPSIVASSGTTIYVDGITEEVSVVAGLRIFGRRTGSTFPVDDVTNFVVGDMCSITGYNQSVRVTAISTANNTLTFDESLTLRDGATPNAVSVIGRWIPIEAPTSSDNLPKTTYIRHFDSNDSVSQNTLRSVMVADNMYFTNQDDEVMKFDGTNIYQAGLFRWQPQLFVQLDTETSSIVGSGVVGTVGSNPANTNVFSVTSGEEVQFAAGDTILFSYDNTVYTVKATTTAKVYVTETITGGGTGTIKKTNRYRYYFRLNAIDSNNNIIASAATGADDFLVDLSESGQIHMRLVGLPVWGIYDYDTLEVEVYRTLADEQAPFYKIKVADLDFNASAGYIDIVDSLDDSVLEFPRDADVVTSGLVGEDLGTAWEQPLRAKYVTTADNRLILANIKDYPELDIVMRKSATGTAITAANLDNKKFLFRKDKTDTNTNTNMVDRATYEFTNGSTTAAVTINPTQAISRTSTSFTIATGSPPAVGSWVYLFHSTADTNNKLDFAGWFQVASIVASTSFTVNLTNSVTLPSAVAVSSYDTGTNEIVTGATHGFVAGDRVIFNSLSDLTDLSNATVYYVVGTPTATRFKVATTKGGTEITLTTTATGNVIQAVHVNRYATAQTATDIPVWIGTDGNYNQVGGNTIDEFTAMLRLANAINSSMRLADTTLSSPDQSTFVPWMTAHAGSEYGVGRLVIRQPSIFDTTLEVKTPAAISTANIFISGVQASASTEYSASTRVFPSRVLLSYPNYPELFDAPFSAQNESTAVIDVNSADGQEITGIIPFFGESVFGGGQAEGVLVVFKENSIYLLDITTRGLTKIQSRGLGCTAPYSIASTRDGIMFANEAGIYRLNRDQRITYVGKFVERIWEDTVNKDQLAIMTGHHYGRGRQYKLSVPSGSASVNSLVLVYDHQREGRDQEFGAWSKYNNHAATGWANLGEDAFFSTTNGQVFSVRNLNEASDYRDDASAISMTITYRALDFGAPGLRKIISGVNSHFQLRRTDMDGTTLYSSSDLDGSFVNAGTFTFTKDNSVKAVSALSSLPSRRMQYLQLKYTNSTKDEDVVLAGIDFHVAGLPKFGLPQQNETT